MSSKRAPQQAQQAQAPPAASELLQALATLGHDEFRPGQREAVETLLSEGRLLLVAPTGGGKSLVYQLPAILLPGTSVVVSPLISLMQDQVAALEARGIAASYFSSTLDQEEMRLRLRRSRQGAYKIIYAAPERLAFEGFRSMLSSLDCPLIAVDEAHCISEWGHDFRPEYMRIGELLATLPGARVLACTATATPEVRDEIVARLGLDASTKQFIHGFARPNLALRVRETAGAAERRNCVDAVLKEVLGGPGQSSGAVIVYAGTRRASQSEGERLISTGWRAATYHAGLNGKVRDRVHREFSSGSLEVVVATNAFGMGIDRADVRAVIHLSPPGSVEAYYQEVGRAGRDGDDAVGLLMISPGDMALRRYLIDSTVSEQGVDPAVGEHKWHMFLELMRWAEGGSCRHDAILRYFGDEAETLSGCGRCDVCTSLDTGAGDDTERVTLIVRKALSAVARINGAFGLNVAAKLLCGSEDPRLDRSGLSALPTFGTLGEHSEQWILRLLRRCVSAGWVDFQGGDRPVVVLTPTGRAVMKAQQPARLLLPAKRKEKAAVHRTWPATARKDLRSGAVAVANDTAESADPLTESLFEALRFHRLVLARVQKVPPYVIATDRSLREIAGLKPADIEELMQVHGIGPAKAEKYGEGLLGVVRESLSAQARSR